MDVRHDLALAVLAAGACCVALAVSSCQIAPAPTSVQAVADGAVAAARNLDVSAGAQLLCAAPTQQQYKDLNESIIERVKRALGGRSPEVSYAVSDVVDHGGAGSFVVTISTPEPVLAGSGARLMVQVSSNSGRSCIDLDSTLQQTGPDSYSTLRIKE